MQDIKYIVFENHIESGETLIQLLIDYVKQNIETRCFEKVTPKLIVQLIYQNTDMNIDSISHYHSTTDIMYIDLFNEITNAISSHMSIQEQIIQYIDQHPNIKNEDEINIKVPDKNIKTLKLYDLLRTYAFLLESDYTTVTCIEYLKTQNRINRIHKLLHPIKNAAY